MGHKTRLEISGRGQGRLIVRKGEVNDEAEGTPIDPQLYPAPRIPGGIPVVLPGRPGLH